MIDRLTGIIVAAFPASHAPGTQNEHRPAGSRTEVPASIEAEFRDCDPRLLALFDEFDATARQGTHQHP